MAKALTSCAGSSTTSPTTKKPKLGGAPAFLTSSVASYVKDLGAAIRAIPDGKPNLQGLETLFIKGVLTEVDKLYVTPNGNDYHEGVHQAIAGTKGLRDQVADYVETAAAFSGDDPNSVDPFIKLMEGLGAHFGPPTTSGQFYPGWADLYSYFALETFLIQTATLIRHGRCPPSASGTRWSSSKSDAAAGGRPA